MIYVLQLIFSLADMQCIA